MRADNAGGFRIGEGPPLVIPVGSDAFQGDADTGESRIRSERERLFPTHSAAPPWDPPCWPGGMGWNRRAKSLGGEHRADPPSPGFGKPAADRGEPEAGSERPFSRVVSGGRNRAAMADDAIRFAAFIKTKQTDLRRSQRPSGSSSAASGGGGFRAGTGAGGTQGSKVK